MTIERWQGFFLGFATALILALAVGSQVCG